MAMQGQTAVGCTRVENHPHMHTDETCGHETRRHGDHLDFEHDGQWHAKHADHWDEHDE